VRKNNEDFEELLEQITAIVTFLDEVKSEQLFPTSLLEECCGQFHRSVLLRYRSQSVASLIITNNAGHLISFKIGWKIIEVTGRATFVDS
jgi:hypothetical protein